MFYFSIVSCSVRDTSPRDFFLLTLFVLQSHFVGLTFCLNFCHSYVRSVNDRFTLMIIIPNSNHRVQQLEFICSIFNKQIFLDSF